MPFSNFLANEILDDVFSGNAYTPPGTFYLALYTVAPTASGGGTELSGNGYARQTVAFTTTAQQSTNSLAVEFPTATAFMGHGRGVWNFRCEYERKLAGIRKFDIIEGSLKWRRFTFPSG